VAHSCLDVDGRSWPKPPVDEPELNGRCQANEKVILRVEFLILNLVLFGPVIRATI